MWVGCLVPRWLEVVLAIHILAPTISLMDMQRLQEDRRDVDNLSGCTKAKTIRDASAVTDLRALSCAEPYQYKR